MYCCCMNNCYNIFRGVPGIDWSTDAAETKDLSRVYYNTYDPNLPSGVG